MEEQIWWYNTLTEFDMLLAHNEKDVKYYSGLTNALVHKMPTLMLTERLGILPRFEWGDAVIIGGNMVRWYGGFDSYIVAREIGDPISAPSMGRKQSQEDVIEDINYMAYMNWREWITALSQFNIGIHLMRTHAAGTFAMNCGFHGIPCIGYVGLDTQSYLHPQTTVEVGDLQRAVQLALKLKNDSSFYNRCSATALNNFKVFYSEETWLKNWSEQFK
jgi:hypothetical protein